MIITCISHIRIISTARELEENAIIMQRERQRQWWWVEFKLKGSGRLIWWSNIKQLSESSLALWVKISQLWNDGYH